MKVELKMVFVKVKDIFIVHFNNINMVCLKMINLMVIVIK